MRSLSGSAMRLFMREQLQQSFFRAVNRKRRVFVMPEPNGQEEQLSGKYGWELSNSCREVPGLFLSPACGAGPDSLPCGTPLAGSSVASREHLQFQRLLGRWLL